MKPDSLTEPLEHTVDPDHIEYDQTGKPYSKDMRIILSQWREAKSYWEKRYKVSRRDKQFVQSKQWSPEVKASRDKYGVATVTWPIIRNFYNHQLGQALPASVDFRVVDTDPRPNGPNDKGNDQAVSVLNGHIRFIDRQSKTHIHRHKARKDQFSGGIGWLGLKYSHSDSFRDGELQVISPRYFDKVFIDPHYSKPDASDADYSFHITQMPWTQAINHDKWGAKIKRMEDNHGVIHEFETFDDCHSKISTIDHCVESEWMEYDSKQITLATHHWRRKVERTYYRFNGKEYIASLWREQKKVLEEAGVDTSGAERRVKKGYQVQERLICGWAILEEKDFFIDHIPWTPIFGYTLEDGEEYTHHGIVHDGVNLQEHANWLASQHATKTSEAQTIGLVKNGQINGFSDLGKKAGIQFYGVDSAADGTGEAPAQIVTTPDNGAQELQYLQFTMELLRQVMNTENDPATNQVINSAQQLALHISDRDTVREELDVNYRTGLECHYGKVIEAIKNLTDEDERIKIVDVSGAEEIIGVARMPKDINFSKYTVSIYMSASGTVQKQQAQQLAAAMMASGDPRRVSMGLAMSVDNSDLANKQLVLKKLYKQQILAGDMTDIPPDSLQNILSEMRQSGELQQALQQMAQPMAQQMLQQMLQQEAIKAEMARSQSQVQTAELSVERSRAVADKAVIDAQRAERTDQLQVSQQVEQTKQDQLRTLRQYYAIVEEIAATQARGQEIEFDLVQKLINSSNALIPNQPSVPNERLFN